MSDPDLEALRQSIRTPTADKKTKTKAEPVKGTLAPDQVGKLLSDMSNDISSIQASLKELTEVKAPDMGQFLKILNELKEQQRIIKDDVKMIIKHMGYSNPVE